MILVIPHYKSHGGAGKYIKAMLSKFRESDIMHRVVGFNAKYYVKSPHRSGCDFLLDAIACVMSLVSYPAYGGVSKYAKIYHFSLLPLKLTLLFFLLSTRSLCVFFGNRRSKSTIILTSSIQIPVLLFSRIFKQYNFIVIVQENIDLIGVEGRLIKHLLRYSSLTISITNSWHNHANEVGVPRLLLVPNSYIIPNDITDCGQLYDCIYVGGGQSIKGFSYLCEEIPLIVEDCRICFLGEYTLEQKRMLERLDRQYSNVKLDVVGSTGNISSYLHQSKLLLLPITHSHFCRPAVEAGLCNRTFLVSDLPNLEDFAIDGYNCIKFNLGKGELARKIAHLLSSQEDVERLSANNHALSMNVFNESEVHYAELIQALKNLI